MEPVWDHTGTEGRSVLRLERPTQVHHQSRKLIKGAEKLQKVTKSVCVTLKHLDLIFKNPS